MYILSIMVKRVSRTPTVIIVCKTVVKSKGMGIEDGGDFRIPLSYNR